MTKQIKIIAFFLMLLPLAASAQEDYIPNDTTAICFPEPIIR